MHVFNLPSNLNNDIYINIINSSIVSGIDFAQFSETTNESTGLLLLEKLFNMITIKQKKLKEIKLADIETLFLTIVDQMNKWSTIDIINMMENNYCNTSDYQSLLFLKTIIYLTDKYPDIIRYQIDHIIVKVSDCLQSLKKEVSALGEICCEKLLISCGNKDLVPFIPDVIKTIKNSEHTKDAIENLAGCIFVQNVEYPALSVLVPIMIRGLKIRKTEIQRKSCVIICINYNFICRH